MAFEYFRPHRFQLGLQTNNCRRNVALRGGEPPARETSSATMHLRLLCYFLASLEVAIGKTLQIINVVKKRVLDLVHIWVRCFGERQCQ